MERITDHSPEERPSGRLAGLLRSLAGSTAGWKRARRGSFLVMVVGTLALLSVFAILYVSIGNQDLRAKAASVHRENLDSVPEQFRDYLANDIIAKDATSIWIDRIALAAGAQGIRPRREATDYPSIDWSRRSDVPVDPALPGFDAAQVFTPVGDYIPALTLTDQRGCLPTDPWLASTEPTYLSYLIPGSPNATDPDEHYLRRKDWANISNVAPDGRFVNLNNLRGNFRASHALMTQNLRVWDASGAVSNTTFFPGVNLDADIPAHFSSYQLHSFRPVVDSAGLSPASPYFPSYQWCDTDGDGMYDARWFEMAQYQDRSFTGAGALFESLIESNDSVRWFFATRIVDLSGLVNVNTSGDFRAAATIAAPAGAGGTAEIDLRRLLTLRDAYDDNGATAGAPGIGYDGLTADTSLGAWDYRGQYTQAAAESVGRFSYNAIRFSLAMGAPLPKTAPSGVVLAGPNLLPNSQAAFLSTGVNAAEYDLLSPTIPLAAGPELRRKEYGRRAGLSFEAFRSTWTESPGTTNPELRLFGAFGVDDQAELLTYWGSNDPAVTSALEGVLGARDDTSTTSPNLLAFSPLRDNRSAQAERRANSLPLTNPVTAEIMTHAASDVRRHLTTISGARSLRSALDSTSARLTNGELKLDLAELLETNSSRSLFFGLADALAPYAYVRDAWDAPSTATHQTYATAFYGNRGPELALHVAGHMAANMRDLYDYDQPWTSTTNPNTSPDTNPNQTVFTLVLSDDAIDRSDPQNPVVRSSYQPDLFPGMRTGRRDYFYLNHGITPGPNADDYLGSSASALHAPILNVYGIEPQPFITGISTHTVYTDSPNGDDEAGDGRSTATIDGSVAEDNKDFLYRALAIQVTNPFDQQISLSTGSPGNVTAEYYLRLNLTGTTTAYLAGGIDTTNLSVLTPVSIEPRSSVVLVILSAPLSDILARVQDNDPGAGSLTEQSLFKNIVANNMEDSLRRMSGVYWIPELDPLTGATTFPAAIGPIITTDTPVVELWRARTADRVAGQTTGDQLIDRMRMPAGADLDRRLPSGQNDIAGSDPDDDGLTITVWANVRRPADPSGSAAFAAGRFKEPQGSFPAFCMEPKYTDAANPNGTTWNIADDDNVSLGTLSMSDFDGAGRKHGNRQSMGAWRAAMASAPVVPAMGTYPGAHGTTDFFGAPISASSPNDPSRRTSRPFFPATEGYQDHYPLLAIDNRRFRRPSDPANAASAQVSGLRVADILLAQGIGPMWAPVDASGSAYDTTNPDEMRKSWTTLAESMAAAMGFERFDQLDTSDLNKIDPLDLYAPRALGTDFAFPLDRGHLWLDRFTPFLDANGNGVFDAGADIRGGLEVPAAAAIFDAFDVFGPGERTLTTLIPGRVNINTATLPALRSLPMVSPMTGINPENSQNNWWWAGPNNFSTDVDLAVSLQAYRERVAMVKRFPSRGTATPIDVGFLDGPLGTPAPLPPEGRLSEYIGLTGRSAATQIDRLTAAGVSEWPGFRTLGEVLLPRQRDATAESEGWNSNVDFLGRNNAFAASNGSPDNDDRAGVNSLIIQPDPALPNTIQTDDIRDDYAEQLAAAQGILSTTTTRSDIFAAWFVVAGFKEGDVAYLGASDQVTPSIKRRFLMIVDRSNVVKAGDKPTVLYFKELPVEN